jgi:CII-binding regulator of phage lambda lysogenization HflD
MRNVAAASAGPADEQTLHIEMHRLLTEKARLERELQMWQANVDRIKNRLVEIDAQVKHVRVAANEMAARSNGDGKSQTTPWDEMPFTYGGG